jgi:manganese efflux pump family protein
MAARLLMIGLVIGSNNLAVALALGSLGQNVHNRLIVGVFGLIEFIVPLVGLLIGRGLATALSERAAILAPILLGGVGAATLYLAFRGGINAERMAARIASLQGLIITGLVLSVDNLVLGFGLGVRGDSPLLVAASISIFSMLFTWTGLRIGHGVRTLEPLARYGSGVLLLALAGFEWLG